MSRGAVLAVLWWCWAAPSAAAEDAYLAELVARARSMELAARVEWRHLLHYQPNLLRPGVTSLVDDPAFFNAAQGKANPQAELEATLAAFFTDTGETESRQPAQCRFVARYRWLNEQFGFDARRLRPAACRRYREWQAALKAQEMTLIFAAAYLNNPASMFGHTLLRVDAKGQDERTRLLAQAINYAAVTHEATGLGYAVKGLAGAFPGRFSMAPYFMKVREYNDLESRDLWEYRLNLTPVEIERLLAHLWELGFVYFDYFFFDENCSYHLLSLLEVARPTLSLADRFRWWAIPADTVAAVVEQQGLLKEAVYRPSPATALRQRVHGMAAGERQLVRDLAERRAAGGDERLAALSPAAQATTIEAAYELANYRRLQASDESAATGDFLEGLLYERSRLPVAPPPPLVPPARPDQGHASARLDVEAGREAGTDFLGLRLRAAYHDLLDAEAGYVRGAQIEFLSLELRKFADEQPRVEELRAVEIVSVSPRDEFFAPWSWKLNIGATRRRLPDGAQPLVTRLNGGGGLAWESGGGLLGLWVEGTFDLEGELEHGYALGAGPALLWFADLAPAWRLQVRARHQRFGAGHEHDAADRDVALRYALSRDSAVRLDLTRRREFGRSYDGARLAWLVYY